MRATQFGFSGEVKEGGFLGFFAKVYFCDVLLIKSYTIFDDVNLRMKITIRGETTEYKENFSFLVSVVDCDAESMFQSIQQVIDKRNMALEELFQENPGEKFYGLRAIMIKFLSGIRREQVSVSRISVY